ncbi:MAG: hypothetical protein PUB21_00740 [Bacteroidales bacterium]|nr:hypothetical protein [Bacteroidales bacterium]
MQANLSEEFLKSLKLVDKAFETGAGKTKLLTDEFMKWERALSKVMSGVATWGGIVAQMASPKSDASKASATVGVLSDEAKAESNGISAQISALKDNILNSDVMAQLKEWKKGVSEIQKLLGDTGEDEKGGDKKEENKKFKKEDIEQSSKALKGLGGALGGLSKVTNEQSGAWLDYSANIIGTIAEMIPVFLGQAMAGAIAGAQMAPFPFNLISMAASVAAVVSAFASIPKFAGGGVVFGRTFAEVGEYAGASSNPEVIAPLSRLQGLLSDVSGVGGQVTFRIEGRDLVGVINKYNTKMARV